MAKQRGEIAYTVPITVTFDAIVFVKPGEKLSDKISDIEIPENAQCSYRVDSSETEDDEIFELEDYDHLTARQKKAIRQAVYEAKADQGKEDEIQDVNMLTIKNCVAMYKDSWEDMLLFNPETGEKWKKPRSLPKEL